MTGRNQQLLLPKANSPWVSLIILLALTLICTFSVQLFVLAFFVLVTGDFHILLDQGVEGLLEKLPFLYGMLAASNLGTFLLPPLILQRIEKNQGIRYWGDSGRNWGTYLLMMLAFLLVCNPVMEAISLWNMDMQLPKSLGGVERWMRMQEDQMALLTEKLVMVTSFERLFLNIAVMAIIPAIAEEFYFRGVLQHIMTRLWRNTHVAVWLTAIIFSAIHMQFYGFFPRMILGLIFGYAFLWTRNIWIPVFGHFINNATVTVFAFVYARGGKSFQEMQESGAQHVIIYILSFIASCVVIYYFYKLSHKNDERKLG